MKRGKAKSPRARPAAPPPSRRGAFWCLALILPSLFFFLLLETGLRLAGYGYPTDFFVPISGRRELKPNEAFGRRFFPPALVRVPLPCALEDPKPDRTYRIFLLGGSAAQGFPEARYGMGRILEAMLNASCPDKRFEVINTAMTAINSHVVLPIARCCAHLEPDLLVVYLGNNEVVGPFGAGTVIGGAAPSLPILRAGIQAKTFKTGQLLSDGARRLLPAKNSPSGWKGMEMFLANQVAADDPRLEPVYAHFARNLRDICRAGQNAGARTLLCTVAVNLRDNPPFASLHRPGLSEADRDRWQTIYAAGVAWQDEGRPTEALAAFREAAGLDGDYAELHFRMAQCLWSAGLLREARDHFARARELDALRFRADQRINAAIRSVSAAEADRGVFLVDAAAAFADTTRARGLPGAEFFWDHVHLNWAGNYKVARLLFARVRELLPPVTAAEPTPPSPERCAELLLLTAADEHRMAHRVTAMMELAPFTAQTGHAAAQKRRRAEVARLRAALTPERLREITASYGRAVAAAPDDLFLRENLARYLGGIGDYPGATRQWRELLARVPEVTDWMTELGLALRDEGKLAAALEVFGDQLQLNPASVDGHNNLGLTLAEAGRLDEAVRHFRRAIEHAPGSAEPHSNLGSALRMKGQWAEALEEYRLALAADPAFLDAHLNIAEIHRTQGRPATAIEQYREALRHNPLAVGAHLGLAATLTATGRPEEAARQIEAAVAADPATAVLHYHLAVTREGLGQPDAALEAYRAALRLDPEQVEVQSGLGNLLLSADRDLAAAAEHLRYALTLRGDWLPALNGLARLLATAADPQLRNPREAIALAERACRLTQQRNPVFLQTAALAHDADGQRERARSLAQRAWDLARAAGDTSLLVEIERDLRRYRSAGDP